MAERFSTIDDLYNKVEWEGGVYEAICGYGISSDELPLDTPADITEAWERVSAIEKDIRKIYRWLCEDGDDQC